MRIFLAPSRAKAALDASAIATCNILQDDSVQWPHMKISAANCCIHIAANGNDHLLLPPIGGTGPSSTCGYNGIPYSASTITNSWFEDKAIIDVAHGEYPKTLTPISDTLCFILRTRYSHRGPGSEHIDVGQIKNFWSSPDFEPVSSTGHASQHNACITEEDAEWEVRVGQQGYATRWKKGSVLRYTICTETFKSPQQAALVARKMVKAILMWGNIGTRFQKVDRDEKATFAIRYCSEPDNYRPDVYARAFFPKTSPGELFIYQLALDSSNIDFLAGILAHELGHILGLSHEFARTSFLWGKKNSQSVMNYFSDPSHLQVRQQDREDLGRYYRCKEGQYQRREKGKRKKLSITDIEPQLYRFPRSNTNSVSRRRPAPRGLYLNYLVRRVRFRHDSLSTRRAKQ